MAPTRSWTALVLLSPLVASLPLPLQPAESEPEDYTNTHTNTNTNIHPSLEARSPDPRMIPNNTDLLSNLFAKLGMEQLDELNKLHHDEHPEDNAIIDDSQGPTVTVTSHDSYFDVVASPVASSSASPSASASRSPSASSTTTSSPVASSSAGVGASITEGEDSASDADGDGDADADSDPTEDPQGFMDSLFDELRKKFREVINGSDEVTLR